MNEMLIVLSNDRSEIVRLDRELESFGKNCGLSGKTLAELNLVLEEVVANVIFHAYDDNLRHEIVVRAISENKEMVVEVEDDGRPFNPLQVPPPDLERPLDQIRAGGLGLHLLRRFTSDLAYERTNNKNRLLIRKKIE